MENNKRPQLKRKIREISKDDLPTKIGGKLFHELREVHQACKKAKTFETQKLVKKLKSLRKASSESKEITDLEAQLLVLKDIDLHTIGNAAFKTKVLKNHTLKDNDDVKASLEKEIASSVLVPAASGTPLGKVQSRLLSHKHLSTQILASISGLVSLLDPEHKSQTKKAKTDPEPQTSLPPTLSKPRLKSKPQNDDSDEEGGVPVDGDSGTETSEVDDGGWESGSVGGEDAEGWESGSVGPSEASGSGNEDDDDSDGDEKDLPRKEPIKIASKAIKGQAKERPASKPAKAQESTFLPSLAVGYISGSDDSDIEDEAEVAEPRKNRRGQRARRAIWEKKFGQNANHKKAEEKAGKSTQTEFKYPKGRPFGNTRYGDNKTRVGGPLLSGSNLTQVDAAPRKGFSQTHDAAPAPKPKVTQGLHPSWEAKRKLKEKDSIVASQGTKIKF